MKESESEPGWVRPSSSSYGSRQALWLFRDSQNDSAGPMFAISG